MASSELQIDGDTLRWGERTVALAEVEGFVERFDRWTGRAWLEVLGPGWRLPVGEGYGPLRRTLRRRLRDRPFDADWADGRFPAAPLGLPGDLVLAIVGVAVLAVGGAVAWLEGAAAGAAVVGAAVYPLARLRDAVVVRQEGLRAGPAWAPPIPWHEIEAVCVRPSGRGVRVWTRGARGQGSAVIPAVLLPALRARVRRLGGLDVITAEPTLDDRYASWIAPASGLPWGLLLATAALTCVAADPWPVLGAGLLTVAATALLGAAVEARATGWGAGAVLLSTGAYAVVLVALGVGGLLQSLP